MQHIFNFTYTPQLLYMALSMSSWCICIIFKDTFSERTQHFFMFFNHNQNKRTCFRMYPTDFFCVESMAYLLKKKTITIFDLQIWNSSLLY